MDRIGAAGGSPTATLSNLQQGFQDENLSTGTEGTLVPSAWMNALQEELMTIQEVSGQPPDISNFAQLRASILLIAQPRFYAYLPQGSFQFVPVAGMYGGIAIVIGGGGGGGPGNGYAGFGGAAGGVSIGSFSCVPGTAMGGITGLAGAIGGPGQSSSFANISATGGGAGTGGSSGGPTSGSYPNPGQGFSGALNLSGGLGSAPIQNGGYLLGGVGGQGLFGGGGPGGLSAGTAGADAFLPGAGGGGGTGQSAGGHGGSGLILIVG